MYRVPTALPWRRPASRPAGRTLAWLAATTLGALALQAPAGARASEVAETLLQAVVGVYADVPATARSAAGLGTERAGSGVIIDASGLVLTVGYLIMEASAVRVRTVYGESGADVLAHDHESGLGLLRMHEAPARIRPLRLGNAAGLAPRSPLVLAGYDDGVVAQAGLVTDRREFAGYWEYLLPDAIFVAPAHPHFGGAAAVDATGRLVGIGSLALANAGPEGRPLRGNLFVPVDALQPVLGEMLASGDAGRPSRPWLGVYAQPLRDRLLVTRVAVDGPAERAGLQRGDIILGVDGQRVRSLAEFYRKLWASGPAGTTVAMALQRGDTFVEASLASVDRRDWVKAAAR